jgi:solute:Na+ symporter, SSS family
MTGNFEFLDYLIFTLYAILILGVGLWVSRDKKGIKKMLKIIF